MAKKKLSLKPVQRGFATTSAAKKPQPQQPPSPPSQHEATPEQPLDDQPREKVEAESTDAKKEDWEDDDATERNALQGFVDKLHEKGEKEVVRVIKAIEFDQRLGASFPKVEINQSLRDQALETALEEERANLTDSSDPPTVTHPAANAPETEKGLLRFFIAYHVLQRLGFRTARIEQCFLQGLKEGEGWEEALEWLWLHCTEDECLQKGEFAKQEERPLEEPEEALLPALESVIEEKVIQDAPPLQTASVVTGPDPSTTTSLFQAADSESDSGSDLDDVNSVNEQWARLQLSLDTLRGPGSGKKGKKGKGSGVVLDTPEIRGLKEKIAAAEKEYMFSRKHADSILKTLKSQRNAESIAAKFKGLSTRPEEKAEEQVDKDVQPEDERTGLPVQEEEEKPKATDSSSILDASASDDDDGGGLFGAMLDEPTQPKSGIQPDTEPSSSTSISVRSMPIPKQLSFAGTIPKNVLKAAFSKATKQVVLSYVNLSGHSKAARAGLECRWQSGSDKGRRIWRMDDLACDDMAQAENYVSTLALSDLEAEKLISGVNWRTMPAAYRELWEELGIERREKEDASRREVWKTIKNLWDAKATEAIVEKGIVDKSSGGKEKDGGETKGVEMDKEDVFVKKIQDDYARRRESAPYQTMLKQRGTLPIASFRDEILATLEQNQVMVFSGETGCGKSTQLPSYILENHLSQGKPCKIVVTEPRRISAISLAQRVSQELGDATGAVGSLSSLVGYSIRLESKTSANTRLSFVTNGIALRMLESGSSGDSKGTAFDEITHIIVDEVHERSIESDFLLIVLKNLCQTRPDLKVVLMSATVDAEKISNFFGGAPYMSVPGRTFPVTVNYLEDAVELAGWSIDERSPYAVRGRRQKPQSQMVEWNEEGAKSDSDPSDDEDESTSDNPAKLSSARYSSQTASTLNLLDSRQIPYDLIVALLEKVCYDSLEHVTFSQATLVFMPGLAEIRKLNDMLLAHPHFGSQDFVVWPLHSSISSEGQGAVFQKPPKGVRKIVISTNIAETGVTIPDITCVIDTGKQREMRYDEKRQLSRFVESYVARSNAKQRRGRAGRVQEGLAFHLFTKARHDTQLAEHPIPEMLRLSLQDLALRIKILKVPLGNTISSVLLQALDPPSAINIQRAISSLVEVKALTVNEDITPLGRLLSKLPMDVHLGKFLLVAAMYGCLDPALTIAATLNSKSPFVTPFGFEPQARAAKAGFAIGNSDFLTIANVFASWRRASDNHNFVRTFCKRNYVSQQNLQQIEELRQQLLAYLVDTAFPVRVSQCPSSALTLSRSRFSKGVRTRFVPVPAAVNVNGEDFKVLGAALVSGLYPKLLALDPSGGLKTITNQQHVVIHPSSVNFKVPYKGFGTNYLAYFTIMHSKRLYAWETGPVEDTALALVCGDIADFKISASSLIIDRRIKYNVAPKTALAIKLIREQFASVMSMRLRGKTLSNSQRTWFDLGLKCLVAGLDEEEGAKIGVV
ncbi:DEAH box polypeptide 36 [Cryptococcus wingfieldii CBS 7118]|uniref:RNA helicase n=1 Tax=Cryptococcus wingfieldii CBS 7118 TaxID=1295528 RepID=A0A1E3J2K0_9TREE|nr:DEAH box polypeptide 36 [Cryptococcus wingfieldii CBS 7118]ODN94181.1 DEAH box polypeptide 36 [Cryptococcus wingfieldii CBS 7118]